VALLWVGSPGHVGGGVSDLGWWCSGLGVLTRALLRLSLLLFAFGTPIEVENGWRLRYHLFPSSGHGPRTPPILSPSRKNGGGWW
jgi:hypothetical protein